MAKDDNDKKVGSFPSLENLITNINKEDQIRLDTSIYDTTKSQEIKKPTMFDRLEAAIDNNTKAIDKFGGRFDNLDKVLENTLKYRENRDSEGSKNTNEKVLEHLKRSRDKDEQLVPTSDNSEDKTDNPLSIVSSALSGMKTLLQDGAVIAGGVIAALPILAGSTALADFLHQMAKITNNPDYDKGAALLNDAGSAGGKLGVGGAAGALKAGAKILGLKGAVKVLGLATPGVGATIDEYNAYKRDAAGEYVGAALDHGAAGLNLAAGAAAAGIITAPAAGVLEAGALGLNGINAVRDSGMLGGTPGGILSSGFSGTTDKGIAQQPTLQAIKKDLGYNTTPQDSVTLPINQSSVVSTQAPHVLSGQPTAKQAIQNALSDKPQPTIDQILSAILDEESSHGKNTIGPAVKTKSGDIVHAVGPMGQMPAMSKAYDVKDPYNFLDAWIGSKKLLQDNMKMFGGDLEKGLAAYNSNPGDVRYAVDAAKKDHSNWMDHLPKGTKEYVQDIEQNAIKLPDKVPDDVPYNKPPEAAYINKPNTQGTELMQKSQNANSPAPIIIDNSKVINSGSQQGMNSSVPSMPADLPASGYNRFEFYSTSFG